MILDEENRQTINLVQAMLGNVSDNLRAVSLVCAQTRIVLHFALHVDNSRDREDIKEIALEFEALQLSNIDVDTVVHIAPSAESVLPGRLVFLRKQDERRR